MEKIEFVVKNDGDTLVWAEKLGLAQETINGMILLDKMYNGVRETTYTITNYCTDELMMTYTVDANGDVDVIDNRRTL